MGQNNGWVLNHDHDPFYFIKVIEHHSGLEPIPDLIQLLILRLSLKRLFNVQLQGVIIEEDLLNAELIGQ